MSNKDYKQIILDGLLKKYNNRYAKNITTNRRIILKPKEVYKDYDRNNADILEKQGINEAVTVLTDMGFVTADYLKFSDDIEKIYFSEEKLNAVYEYLKEEYGVVPQSIISKQVHEIVNKYICTEKIVQHYCESILAQVEDPRCVLVPEKIEANLKMFSFLEKNKENLYVREVSMLVYGDSKWFENNNYEEICTFLRTATGRTKEEGERNDNILSFFYVTPAEQEIFIKGNWIIELEQYALDISKLQGGIAIASSDVRRIKSISVIGNILVHRDYSSAYPAKVIIEKDWMRTENWCIPRRHGNIMSDEFTPYPKNPLIQQFFANIGRTDTIGSGVRNLYKYTPMYSDGGKPELIEDDVFRINIPLDRIAADEATEQKTLSEREQKIYNMICENLHLSVEQVMVELDISRSTVFRDYAKIKKVTGAVYDKKTSTWTLQ